LPLKDWVTHLKGNGGTLEPKVAVGAGILSVGNLGKKGVGGVWGCGVGGGFGGVFGGGGGGGGGVGGGGGGGGVWGWGEGGWGWVVWTEKPVSNEEESTYFATVGGEPEHRQDPLAADISRRREPFSRIESKQRREGRTLAGRDQIYRKKKARVDMGFDF